MEEAENKKKRKNSAWLFLLMVPILAVVAMCDSDFNFKNPFARDKPAEDTLSTDTVVTELNDKPDSVAYELAEEDTVAGDDSHSWDFSSTGYEEAKQWRLVVSSVVNKSDAEEMLIHLDHAGAEIKYVAYLDTYRVVYESYSDLKEAQASYDQISRRYPRAWLVYF